MTDCPAAARLYRIEQSIAARVDGILSTRSAWPCRKGCDHCFRHLASLPRVSREEWTRIHAALDESLRRRIRESANARRPIVCPLLDTAAGVCLIYDVRPAACRAYGFYAARDGVLGCNRIEAIAAESRELVWGNHDALERELEALGPAEELSHWLAAEIR